MSRIVIMGPPGVGKGTQAKIVSETLGVPQIMMDGLFREHIARETALGLTIATTLASGLYVSDEIATDLLRDRLARADTANGFVLDGYPRTVAQVKALDDLLLDQGVELDRVLLLGADVGIIRARLSDRGRDGRADDMNEVPSVRLAMYFEQTEPIAQIYESRGLLRRVDAAPSIERVAQAVAQALPEASATL